MSDLEARYRRLFAAYPAAQRTAREDEMVGLLLDLAEPGQRHPSRREALSIVANGLACRARSAEEWRAGLAWGGAVAAVVATAMAVVGLGVAVLPGDSPQPVVPGAEAPPIVGWAVALLAVGLAVGWPSGRVRSAVTALVLGVGVGVVLAGPQLMGPLRGQLVAFALFLALSLAAADTSRRTRAGAVAGGLVLGIALLGRLLAENVRGSAGPGPDLAAWERQSRWVLAADVVPTTPTLWYGLVALGLTCGLLRPRFAVAAAALAVPAGLLAFREASRVPVEDVLVVSAAVVVLVAVALGRRTAAPPRPVA